MLRSLFVLVCLGVGGVAALRSRFGALLFYLWFALFRPQEWLWVDITQFRLSLIIGLMLVVPSLLTGLLPNVTHPLSLLMWGFLASAFIAHQEAVAPVVSAQWLDFMTKLCVVSLYIVTLTRDRRQFLILIAVIAGSLGFFTAKAGLFAAISGGARYWSGVAGAFSDNNTYAIGATMAIPLLVLVAQNSTTRWISRAFWVSAPLTALTVVSTYSRAGFLALLAMSLVLVWFQKKRAALLSLMGASAVALLLVVPIPESYWGRMQTIRTYDEVGEASALSRLHFWRVALNIARDHPLGVGLWGYESIYDRYDDTYGSYGRRRAVHNSELQALVDAGWLGGTLFLLLLVGSLVVLFRIRHRARRLSTDQPPPDSDSLQPPNTCVQPPDAHFLLTSSGALIASIVAFIVGGFFVSMAYNDLTWILFGATAALDRMSKAKPPPEPEWS